MALRGEVVGGGWWLQSKRTAEGRRKVAQIKIAVEAVKTALNLRQL